MCGLVGGTAEHWDYEAALDALTHRGPDAGCLIRGKPFTAGFRRLSIIDLRPSANQPMFADDGESWILFNGEMYGYAALRRRLEAAGMRFRTASDTEVVLRGYLHWGDDFLAHMDGMFAIVIWDAARRCLKLYRDRSGIKPLYYFWNGHDFGFASELKGLKIACRQEGLSTDHTALYDFMIYRYVPAPKTPYRECFKLRPAHSLTFYPDTRTLDEPRRYWSVLVPEEPRAVSAEEAAEELRALLAECVREQMVADVPVGFFLSGGVDSSTVVAAAASTGSRLETFSIGFDTAEHSETEHARAVAAHFGAEHTERILTREAAHALMPRMKEWFDEPFADESALPTYFVSAAAREKVTVVVTGDGGDEVFGGYRTYLRFERYSRYPNWPRFMDGWAHALRRLVPIRGWQRALMQLEWAFSGDLSLWAKLMKGMSPYEARPYAAEFGIPRDYDHLWHFRAHWRPEVPLRTRLQLLDFGTYLPDEILTKVDRASMAVSLEARVPLLDRRIVEFSFGLPEPVRFHGGPKGLLRFAYRDAMPPGVFDRKKKGFGIPRYYLRDLGPFGLRQLLLEEHLAARSHAATSAAETAPAAGSSHEEPEKETAPPIRTRPTRPAAHPP